MASDPKISLATPILSQPLVNSLPEELAPRYDPVFAAHHNAYNAGRLHTHQIPIEAFRKDPKKYLISYGKASGPATGFTTKDITVDVTGGIDPATKEAREPGQIKIRVYTPDGENTKGNGKQWPAYVNYHGGGWVFGDIETDVEFCKRIAVEVGAVVFDIEYRCSPEWKFPVPVEDSWEGFKYIYENASSFNVDNTKISVGGCSAGGHLAAVIAQLCRDTGIQLAYQLLNVPVVDMHSQFTAEGELRPDCPYPSYHEMQYTAALPAARMSYFHNHFIPEPRDAVKDKSNEYNLVRLSPILAKTLKGVAPAFVFTAEMDPLCDEGEAYAKRLQEEGIEVKTYRAMGCPHTATGLDDILEGGRKFSEISVQELKRVFYGE